MTYDWRADFSASWDFMIGHLRLEHVAQQLSYWRDCRELYAWEAGQ